MRRREFIALASSASVAWSLSARAQEPTARVYRVGGLAIASREQELDYIGAF